MKYFLAKLKTNEIITFEPNEDSIDIEVKLIDDNNGDSILWATLPEREIQDCHGFSDKRISAYLDFCMNNFDAMVHKIEKDKSAMKKFDNFSKLSEYKYDFLELADGTVIKLSELCSKGNNRFVNVYFENRSPKEIKHAEIQVPSLNVLSNYGFNSEDIDKFKKICKKQSGLILNMTMEYDF